MELRVSIPLGSKRDLAHSISGAANVSLPSPAVTHRPSPSLPSPVVTRRPSPSRPSPAVTRRSSPSRSSPVVTHRLPPFRTVTCRHPPSFFVPAVPQCPLPLTVVPGIHLPSGSTPDKILSQVARPAVFAPDGGFCFSKTRTGYFAPSRPVPGSWQSVRRALPGAGTVGNTGRRRPQQARQIRANTTLLCCWCWARGSGENTTRTGRRRPRKAGGV